MKINFAPCNADDGRTHAYCVSCGCESAVKVTDPDGRISFRCVACNNISDRAIVFDPAVAWQTNDDGELVHETAGIFVFTKNAELLVYELNKIPYGLTVPAGHIGPSEDPRKAAARELREETGLYADENRLIEFAQLEIVGDPCSRGADIHYWHCYAIVVDQPFTPEVNAEGHTPTWLPIYEARSDQRLTTAVRSILAKPGYFENILLVINS